MTDLIRSACLTHYPEVARSVGLDPLEMLRKVRLPVNCLDDPDLRIAVSGLRRLLEASAAAAGVDEFGLRMAERGGLSNLGPVALVVREQSTVGTAIEALARFIHIHHEGMRLKIERDAEVVMISVTLRGGRPRAPRQSTELAVGTIDRIIRSLFGDDWRPLDVHLMHSPPRNRRYYRAFFGCNVIFNSEADAILLAAEDLERPIPTAHPMIADYLPSASKPSRHDPASGTTRSANWCARCCRTAIAPSSGWPSISPATGAPFTGIWPDAAPASPRYSTPSAPISCCG